METKKSRTKELLVQLNVGKDFLDPQLPRGLLSHSQYTSFRICGAAYEYKYILDMPQPGSGAMSRGSAVHKAIEAALKKKMEGGPVLPIDQAKEVVSHEFDERAKEVANWGDDKPGAMKDQAVALYDAFHTRALPRLHPVAIEKGWATKFGGVPMAGWIDMIDEQPAMDVSKMSAETAALVPTKQVVVDFKTAKSKWSEKDVRLDTQLTLYSAVEGTPDVRVDQLIPYKRGAEYVRAESQRTPQDVAVLEEDVAEVAQYIRQGIFPKTSIDSWACCEKFCAYWNVCRGRKRS